MKKLKELTDKIAAEHGLEWYQPLNKAEDSAGMTAIDLGSGYSLHHEHSENGHDIWAVGFNGERAGTFMLKTEDTRRGKPMVAWAGLEKPHRGKGIGTLAYKALAAHYGGIDSDKASSSDDAIKAWLRAGGRQMKIKTQFGKPRYTLDGDKKNPPIVWNEDLGKAEPSHSLHLINKFEGSDFAPTEFHYSVKSNGKEIGRAIVFDKDPRSIHQAGKTGPSLKDIRLHPDYQGQGHSQGIINKLVETHGPLASDSRGNISPAGAKMFHKYGIKQPDESYMLHGQSESLKKDDESYRIAHTAPTSDGGSPLHNLKDTYPDDIYSHEGVRYYGHGVPYDHKAISVIHAARNKPNAKVRIYRAVPKTKTNAEKIQELEQHKKHILKHGTLPNDAWSKPGGGKWNNKSEYYEYAHNTIGQLKELFEEAVPKKLKINTGDWVATTREYAKEHGDSVHGKGNYEILSAVVPAAHVWTDGNSIHEWGYDPTPLKKSFNSFLQQVKNHLERVQKENKLLNKLDSLKKSEDKTRVASIVVCSGDKMLMLQRRDNDKWTFPGGHLNNGESFINGAVRELWEEAGIRANPDELILLGDKQTFQGKTIHVYLYKVNNEVATTASNDPDKEAKQFKWLPHILPEEIKENLYIPVGDNASLSMFMKYLLSQKVQELKDKLKKD